LAVPINKRLHRNLITVAIEAKQKLSEAGVSAKEVPLSIIHLLLQAASVEEEPKLQTLWANLLANAADPRGHGINKSFVGTLKELSRTEALVLQERARFKASNKGKGEMFGPSDKIDERTIVEFSEPVLTTALSESEWRLLLDNLVRLGLIRIAPSVTLPRPEPRLYEDVPTLSADVEDTYYITDYGVSFIAACQPPNAS
jgi:hypothetical protein